MKSFRLSHLAYLYVGYVGTSIAPTHQFNSDQSSPPQ